ncbi:MAG: CNP1-like family protein [Nitrosomonas sp.]|nr:CNP1-like family protein [Nitrosomonas sp.]
MKLRLVFLSLVSLVSCSSNEKFVDTFDNSKNWVEIQAQLPNYPETENLLEFDAGPANDMRHYVDAQSIAIGEDGVIRFTLISKSSEGAENVSFEGIRCRTRERKRYAVGRLNKTWAHSRQPEWQLLNNVGQNHALRELAKFYFCPQDIMVGSQQEAIQALKAGIHPRVVR